MSEVRKLREGEKKRLAAFCEKHPHISKAHEGEEELDGMRGLWLHDFEGDGKK